MKTGAISDYADAHPIRSMKYSASPVVPVAVAPKNLADLPKLFDGHKKLSKSDPLVVCIIEETGENIVVRCGELYVEICPNDLEKDFAQCELIKSDPVVTYKETVTAKTGQSCLTKSQNKHNIIYASGEPLVEGLQETIEKGGITPDDNVKTRAKRLYEEFEWEKDDALKIWGVSDLTTRPNVVVIMSKTVQYMNEIKDSMVSAWQGATKNGVLTEENRIGFRVDVIDCELHADATQRGRGQILPWARRLFYACELSSVPILYEPIFLCEITAPMEATGGMYLILNQRRGQVLDSKQIPAPLNLVTYNVIFR
jgi:elongation factor 2